MGYRSEVAFAAVYGEKNFVDLLNNLAIISKSTTTFINDFDSNSYVNYDGKINPCNAEIFYDVCKYEKLDDGNYVLLFNHDYIKWYSDIEGFTEKYLLNKSKEYFLVRQGEENTDYDEEKSTHNLEYCYNYIDVSNYKQDNDDDDSRNSISINGFENKHAIKDFVNSEEYKALKRKLIDEQETTFRKFLKALEYEDVEKIKELLANNDEELLKHKNNFKTVNKIIKKSFNENYTFSPLLGNAYEILELLKKTYKKNKLDTTVIDEISWSAFSKINEKTGKQEIRKNIMNYFHNYNFNKKNFENKKLLKLLNVTLSAMQNDGEKLSISLIFNQMLQVENLLQLPELILNKDKAVEIFIIKFTDNMLSNEKIIEQVELVSKYDKEFITYFKEKLDDYIKNDKKNFVYPQQKERLNGFKILLEQSLLSREIKFATDKKKITI